IHSMSRFFSLTEASRLTMRTRKRDKSAMKVLLSNLPTSYRAPSSCRHLQAVLLHPTSAARNFDQSSPEPVDDPVLHIRGPGAYTQAGRRHAPALLRERIEPHIRQPVQESVQQQREGVAPIAH